MAPQGTLLLGEESLLLGLQGTRLCAGALGTRLTPGVDHVHASGDAGLHHAGKLVAVAGHGSTLRRGLPAWHPRPART